MKSHEILAAAAATNRQRNKLYKSCYRGFGDVLKALFPGGKVPECKTPEEMNRMNAFFLCAGKLHRYAQNFTTGGHQDSARDLQVYAAMLEEFTAEKKGTK